MWMAACWRADCWRAYGSLLACGLLACIWELVGVRIVGVHKAACWRAYGSLLACVWRLVGVRIVGVRMAACWRADGRTRVGAEERALLVALAITTYIRCIHGVFGREITKCTVIFGAHIRFWPTLLIEKLEAEALLGL